MKKNRSELLEEQALKRNGRIIEVKEDRHFPGPITYNKLILSHSGFTNIEIYTKPGYEDPDYTIAKASFTLSKNVTIELDRRRGISRLFRQYTKTGNPEFDDAFNIRANDRNLGRRFFTPKVQHKLISIKGRLTKLRITQRELTLRTISALSDREKDYDNFIETAFSLFESLQRHKIKK